MEPNKCSFFTPFDRPPQVRLSFNPDKGRTKQEFRDECDINVIVRNFVRHGALSPRDVNARTAMYQDVSDYGDLKDCMDKVDRAAVGFYTLPAAVREKFGNSPVRLLQFVSDPANKAEAIELGLLKGVAPVIGAPEAPAPRPSDAAVK